MKREIKFRAWDKIMNKWMHPVWDITNPFPINNGHEIMQFTGLTDKNGKEIYEGDICKYKDELILWRWDELHCGFWPRKIPASDWSFNTIHTSANCEVIGNIHENPELL